VLHHTDAPAVLLGEALRVLRPDGRLLIKDHIAFGPWSRFVLLLMDFVGNAPKGASARGQYMTGPQWMAAIAEADAYFEKFVWPLEIHARPWSLIARSSYQFAASIRRLPPPESPDTRTGA
jgi:SAM-dependent methyltransferase